MNFRKSVIVAILALGMLNACGEKKAEEVEVDTAAVEAAAAQIEKEAAEKEAKIKAAKKKVADSLKKVDSLRQVKEHGHAH